ncbi:MAG: TolC family protein [Thermodesulfobacteriota bacterium]
MKINTRKLKQVLAAILLTFGTVSLCSAETPITATGDLDRIIEEGLAENGAIKSMEAEIDALKNEITAAGALPDPKLGVGLLNMPVDTFSFRQAPMTQKQVSLEQAIPWLSKLDLESKTVALTARQKAKKLDGLRLSIARKIAENYYQLGDIAYRLDINEQLIDMVKRIRRDTQDRYAVGEGLQQDIFEAEVKLNELEDMQIMLESNRKTLEDRLNALLNRKQFESVSPPQTLPLPEMQLSKKALTRAALANNPDILAQQAAIARAQTAVELAGKDYYPDCNVSFAYGQREEDAAGNDLADFFTAAVKFDLPVWQDTKQDKKLAAALENRRAAKRTYQDLVRRLPHDVDALIAEIRDLRSRYRVYQDRLLPNARQWARSAVDAYEVGDLEFSTMIEAKLRVLRFAQQMEGFVYQIYQKRAAMEATVGLPVAEIEKQDNTNKSLPMKSGFGEAVNE